jgi:hypothetical protein
LGHYKFEGYTDEGMKLPKNKWRSKKKLLMELFVLSEIFFENVQYVVMLNQSIESFARVFGYGIDVFMCLVSYLRTKLNGLVSGFLDIFPKKFFHGTVTYTRTQGSQIGQLLLFDVA